MAVPRVGGQEYPAAIPEVNLDGNALPAIRPARVSDVHGMSALINQYASANVMLARGPQYLYQHIQDYMVATAPSVLDGTETVIACGAVHVLWHDLAEIRSIAVHSGCNGHGIGGRLVNELISRCHYLAIPRVFVFTLVAPFFKKCGFSECPREELPAIVWVECSKCPKFYRCDEIAMIRDV